MALDYAQAHPRYLLDYIRVGFRLLAGGSRTCTAISSFCLGLGTVSVLFVPYRNILVCRLGLKNVFECSNALCKGLIGVVCLRMFAHFRSRRAQALRKREAHLVPRHHQVTTQAPTSGLGGQAVDYGFGNDVAQ